MTYLIALVALVLAAVIILTADGRPSFIRTLCGLPVALIGLSFPFVFRSGCVDDQPYSNTYVVTRDVHGTLTTHSGITWCPKRCVIVPGHLDAWLPLANGITFDATFEVENPAALVHALGLDEVDRVVDGNDTSAAAFRALEPLLDGYLQRHQEELLRRRLHEHEALKTTADELAKYLQEEPSAARQQTTRRFAAMGLSLPSLCCTRMEGARSLE